MPSPAVSYGLGSDTFGASRGHACEWSVPHPGRRMSLPPMVVCGESSVGPGMRENSLAKGTATRCDISRPVNRALAVHKITRTKPCGQRSRWTRRAGSVYAQGGALRPRFKDGLMLATGPRQIPTLSDKSSYLDSWPQSEDAVASTGSLDTQFLRHVADVDQYGWDAAWESKLVMEGRQCPDDGSCGCSPLHASQPDTRMSSLLLRLLSGRTSSSD